MQPIARVFALIEQHGTTANKVAVACGLSSGAFTEWRKGKAKPNVDALSKIADHFNVTVDFLLGKEKPATPPPAATGISIARGGEVKHYTLDDAQLKFVNELVEKMANDQENHNKRK